MSNVSYHRAPCPGRIFEDLGVGFSIGCFGGSIFYFFKGLWNAPRRQRMLGGLTHVRNRAPFLGGSFAMWGGVFSSMDCLLIYYRQRDDPYNAIVAGFVTGGVLAIRGGASIAFKNAMVGGVILALIEGVSTIITSVSMRKQYQWMEQEQKRQLEEAKAQLRRGGNDPWAVDYDAKVAEANKEPTLQETLIDKAKSFSF